MSANNQNDVESSKDRLICLFCGETEPESWFSKGFCSAACEYAYWVQKRLLDDGSWTCAGCGATFAPTERCPTVYTVEGVRDVFYACGPSCASVVEKRIWPELRV